MKKSTIWILGVIMGLSFLSLLYLQISYIEEMVKMRNEQFNESVKRALMAASKNVETEEVDRWLREDISDADRRAWEETRGGKNSGLSQDGQLTVSLQHMVNGDTIVRWKMCTSPTPQPRVVISNKHGLRTIQNTSSDMVDAIRNRYLYQRALMEDAVWRMLYQILDKPIADRVSFKNLSQYIRAGLLENGINLNYHFEVVDKDGRILYRCPDYTDEGSEYTYTQSLFLNDPPSQMSLLKIHFPGKSDYIYDSVSFMIPSLIFTLILLVTFIFTIFIIFRQKKLSEMKNDFVNNMTHEFKTPISTISLAAQMLKDPAVGKSEVMLEHISKVINEETKRLRFQVEKVLQMSMFDRQMANLKLQDIDMNELISGVVSNFSLKVERYQGKIETQLDAKDAMVSADDMHITNVIFNLMDNAVKYRKPEVDLVLKVRTWNESGKLMISIQDNGIGIKKEDVKKIFEKFFRVHTGNLHDVKGFGLGLAYVKKIITDHKGTIRAESELNVGTKFIIALPLLKKID